MTWASFECVFRHPGPVGETMPTFFGSLSRSICGEFSDAWPLMQNPVCGDDISLCDSYPGLTGEDTHSLNPENESSSSLDSNSSQDLVGGAVPIHSENCTEATGPSRRNHSLTEPVLTQDTLTARSQLCQENGDIVSLTTPTSLQVSQGLPSRRTQHWLMADPGDWNSSHQRMWEDLMRRFFPSFITSFSYMYGEYIVN